MKRYLITINCLLFCLLLKSQSLYTCQYWFDEDYTQMATATFNDRTWQAELDVGTLSSGIHLLYVQVKDSTGIWCSPQNYMFYKAPAESPINVGDVVYHCWFDQDIEHRQSGSFQTGQFLLDASSLDAGIHMLYVVLEGDGLTAAQSYMFYKAPTESPINLGEVVYHCWFDQDIEHKQSGSFQTGQFLLDASNLDAGIHMLYVVLEGDGLTAAQSYMFYKKPEKSHIARWEYWVNGAVGNPHTTNLSPVADTLEIITLLPVEPWPIRSSCFYFHPNGDEPYINAKNEITFRLWDTKCHTLEKSIFYIDENVFEPIVADTLERNTTTTISAPRDNQIHWFKVEANRGDYLSFQADKACTMQLFAPSGEEVYAASGPESIQKVGFNVLEDGVYYLAVHDVTGSGETVSLTYNWIYRYTILTYDVHLVGNGGCSTVTFQGNGFNSLLDVYLVNWQNDTIRSFDIGHESNTTTTVSLNLYQENLGAYDAVFEFYEETIRINGALEVQEPVDILLTTTVSYPSVFLKNTLCTYTYTITNNGNMSAYVVPLYLYIASPTTDGITYLEIEGLNLPTLDEFINMDSLSLEEIAIIRDWAKEKGYDHYFNLFSSVEDNDGNPVAVRSNFFFVNLAPFESKTIKIKITANTNVEAWMTFPNEVIQPYTFNPTRDFESQFCCIMDHIRCFVNIMSNYGNFGALLSDTFALLSLEYPPSAPFFYELAILVNTASCIVSFADTYISFLDGLSCHYYWEGVLGSIKSSFKNSAWSATGTAFSCLVNLKNLKELLNVMRVDQTLNVMDKLIERIKAIGDLTASGASALIPNSNCSQIFQGKSVDCFPGNPQGGKSNAVNSLDPNDIHGYLSESGSHYMRQEIQNVQYEIEFENDTALATAAAHTIIVRDTLDATKFDLNSLAARSVTIGDKRLDLNGEQTFARTLDLRPENYVIAQINQDYDPTSGIIQWTIQSLDPMTMEPTDDPNQGVLPVNYYGDGVGFIDYSIDIKEAFADGTEISNRAGIIFDQEEVIMTPTWTNIVDAVKPTSHIEEVTLMGDSLSFSFVSSDNRSGVWYHNLYYRNASTEQEWLVKKAQIHGNSFMLPFDSLQTSEYFVIAVDSAGNVEPMKMEAEVVVESNTPGYPFFVAGYGESTKAGWKFIASPIEGGIEATTVDNIFGATQYDLYRFDQSEESEWRNYKTNSFNLINGQAYLYATKEDRTLIFRGTYNDTDSHEVMLMYSDDNPTTAMRGWNLIGNPFTAPAYVDRSYYTMNEEGTTIEPVAVSEGSPIPACHGVMVKAETPAETVTFSRTAQRSSPNQGNIQIVVAQATMRGNIKQDKAVVSFNSNDPLEKFVFDESNTRVYIPQNGKDYAIAYAGKTGEVPVNFKAAKDGTYSLTVNADNKVFDYLHLIDNLTGADVDLSMEPSYTFEAKTTDYASRFRLVFFVREEGDDMPFAFVNNGNIVIIGAQTDAVLQIVDMLGRVILCRDASNASAIATTGMAKGMYVLRLINGDSVKTQKIVVR